MSGLEQIRPVRLSLSASQKNQIMCASQQLKINCRDQFLRRVAKVLECCSQPPSHNDVTHTIRMVMMDIPASEILISRGDTSSDDEFESDCRRRY